MGEKMKRICTICARGGSKGVENKNIRELLGKPLIAHTIGQAVRSKLFDLVAVSSDSQMILDIAQTWGAGFLVTRPQELATDNAAKLPAIKHCVATAEVLLGVQYDIVVDLDATSPLRKVEDIKAAVELLEQHNVSNVITGTPARRSPYFNLVELNETGIVQLCKSLTKQIVRRQDAPECYDMNASIYVWQRDALTNNSSIFNKDTLLYVMPEERSVDIDSELDFEWVSFLAAKRRTEYE